MATKCKYNVGDKVKIKVGKYAGRIGVIDRIADIRLYNRRTFIVKGKDCEGVYVSYELELLSPTNNEALEKEIDKNIKMAKTKIVLEFDHDPFSGIDSKTAQHLKQTASKIAVDETILKNRYGETDVKARTLTITIDEAQKMYKLGGTYRDLVLKLFTEDELNPKPKVPHTWKEYCDNVYPYEKHMHYTPTFAYGFKKEDYDAFIAYGRLIRLRRAWINDWKPTWDGTHEIWCIEAAGEKTIKVTYLYCSNSPLSFPTQEMANNFLECFKDLLVKARGLY